MRKVKIYIVGLDSLGMDHLEDFSYDMESKLLRRLHENFKDLPDIDHVVDSRQFTKFRGPKGCCGEHADAIHGTVIKDNQVFKLWLEKFKREFYLNIDGGSWGHKDTYTILTFCKAGCNRSVSCGRVLFEIFSNLGWNCGVNIYLSRGIWRYRLGRNACYGNCQGCRLRPLHPKKHAAFQRAMETWNQV